MLIYYTIYAIMEIFWGAFCFRRNNKKTQLLFCTLSCLTMIALFAMRHLSMGIDLHYGHSIGYLASYEQTAEMSWREIFHINHFGYERGYVVFIKLLTYFSSDPRFLLTSIAVITMSCVFSVLASYSDDAFLSVIVYIGTPCFVANFSSLRQALAVSLCFFSFRYIKQKKFVPFAIFTAVATLFHTSALLFIAAYFLYNIKIPRSWRYASVVAIPFIYVLRDVFFFVARILKPSAVKDNNGSFTFFLALFGVYVVVAALGDNSDEHLNGLMNIFCVACCIMAFSGIYNTAERLAWYFIIFLALLLPRFVEQLKGLHRIHDVPWILMYSGILACFTLFGLYQIYSTYWAMAYPYYFFWEAA